MMFKFVLTFVLLLSVVFNADCQIQVGSNVIAAMNRGGKIDEDYIQQLKQTTTLFVLQDNDYESVESWDRAIKSVWNITPYRIIKRSDMSRYNDGKYSFFSFGGFLVNRKGTISVHITYDLWMPHATKNNKTKGSDYYSRVLMYVDNESAFDPNNKADDVNSSEMDNVLYGNTNIYNWSPVILKCYLKTINDRLLLKSDRGPFLEEEDETVLKELKNDTLYISQYTGLGENFIRGNTNIKEINEEVKKVYPYPYKVVSNQQLDDIISTSSKPVYFLVYTNSATDKYVNVFEARTGKLLYARYSMLSYKFREKDMAELRKSIK